MIECDGPLFAMYFSMPRDQEDADFAINGMNYWSALSEMKEYLRKLRKYDEREQVSIEEVEQEFFNILEGHKIILE